MSFRIIFLLVVVEAELLFTVMLNKQWLKYFNGKKEHSAFHIVIR